MPLGPGYPKMRKRFSKALNLTEETEILTHSTCLFVRMLCVQSSDSTKQGLAHSGGWGGGRIFQKILEGALFVLTLKDERNSPRWRKRGMEESIQF